jgi:hypothetical protein
MLTYYPRFALRGAEPGGKLVADEKRFPATLETVSGGPVNSENKESRNSALWHSIAKKVGSVQQNKARVGQMGERW